MALNSFSWWMSALVITYYFSSPCSYWIVFLLTPLFCFPLVQNIAVAQQAGMKVGWKWGDNLPSHFHPVYAFTSQILFTFSESVIACLHWQQRYLCEYQWVALLNTTTISFSGLFPCQGAFSADDNRLSVFSSVAMFLHLLFENKFMFNECGRSVFTSHLWMMSIFLGTTALYVPQDLGGKQYKTSCCYSHYIKSLFCSSLF